MQRYEGTDPHILYLSTEWERSDSHPSYLKTCRKSFWYLKDKMLSGLQSQYGQGGNKKILIPARNLNPTT
jgi:hypothetical protein